MLGSRSFSRLAAAALALIVVFFLELSLASPFEQRQVQTTGSSTKSLSVPFEGTSKTPSSSKRLKVYSSTKTTASSTSTQDILPLLPTEQARIATSGPLSTFCGKFVQQCYKVALKGQTGEVSVAYSCERNGGKGSTSFTYSCARGDENLTAKVLKAMGNEFHRPSTSTVDAFTILTDFVEKVATILDTTTTHKTVTDSTVTSTSWTHVVEVDVQTTQSTVSSTTVIPRTVSLTSTSISTDLATATTTTTSTNTGVFIGTGEIPVYRTIAVELDERSEIRRRAPSTFCLAYKIACQVECGRVSSRVRDWICSVSQSTQYTLSCTCKNGKIETQHALEAIAEDRKWVSVTNLQTSTTHLTSTRTTSVLRAVTETEHVTMKVVRERTSTSVSSTTLTLPDATVYTGTPSSVTELRTVATTTSTTSTSTSTASTTTQLVLAATGFLRGFDTTTGEDLGPAGRLSSDGRNIRLGVAVEDALNFMAVRDGPTGLYKLAIVGLPTTGLINLGIPASPIMKPGSDFFSLTSYSDFSECGAAGTAPGPGAGGSTCEAFVFDPLALDPTPGATPDTVSFRPFWINPLGTIPANHTSAWGALSGVNRIVAQVADRDAFVRRYPGIISNWFTLRFPFSS